MRAFVLDASAVLTLLLREPGAYRIAEYFRLGVVVSAINWAEVVTWTVVNGALPSGARTALASEFAFDLVEVIPFDEHLAEVTGSLRPLTRHLGLSLGDRACLALARHLGLPAVTMDRVWADLSIGVQVEVAR